MNCIGLSSSTVVPVEGLITVYDGLLLLPDVKVLHASELFRLLPNSPGVAPIWRPSSHKVVPVTVNQFTKASGKSQLITSRTICDIIWENPSYGGTKRAGSIQTQHILRGVWSETGLSVAYMSICRKHFFLAYCTIEKQSMNISISSA